MEKVFEGKTADQIAEENERLIVRFTNIDKESFTHSFRGISITVGKGESQIMRFPEADHLATHLARKMIARDKKARGIANNITGTSLFTAEEVAEVKEKILSKMGEEATQSVTPEAKRAQDVEMLEKKFAPKPPVEVTKADVIRDLKARGVEADIKKSKEELLRDLLNAEALPK